jgi:benzoyl-CoA reductase/2-hydroxyglutaryl-CoA dehydratase subunit BcrC/BadD/HgdB
VITTQDRRFRLLQRAAQKCAAESGNLLDTLRGREDYQPEFEYFLDLIKEPTAAATERRSGRTAIRLLCIQAPLELIHAAGFQPFRVFSGSHAASALATQGIPALVCPLLRAVLGEMALDKANLSGHPWILPTTCDWVVKLPEMSALTGLPSLPEFHWMELPRLKNDGNSRKRWMDEIWRLKDFLEKTSRHAVTRTALLASIEAYGRAADAFQKLKTSRASGRLSPVWFLLVGNAFFLDAVENWTEQVNRLEKALFAPRVGQNRHARIFLAGSPLVFPNFKLPFLFEEAGLWVVADDLCSSERLFPGKTFIADTSVFGMLSTLAGRYHQGCLCPIFADNDRRINNILGRRPEADFRGVVFEVLKGCHPYDLESFTLEKGLKAQDLKFIRLETDYSPEDTRNLLTRLEAYRATLEEA